MHGCMRLTCLRRGAIATWGAPMCTYSRMFIHNHIPSYIYSHDCLNDNLMSCLVATIVIIGFVEALCFSDETFPHTYTTRAHIDTPKFQTYPHTCRQPLFPSSLSPPLPTNRRTPLFLHLPLHWLSSIPWCLLSICWRKAGGTPRFEQRGRYVWRVLMSVLLLLLEHGWLNGWVMGSFLHSSFWCLRLVLTRFMVLS